MTANEAIGPRKPEAPGWGGVTAKEFTGFIREEG
jgi:hypothetical protein